MAQAEWDRVTLRTTCKANYQAKRDEYADLARAGRWPEIIEWLGRWPSFVNAWRPGGRSWYTVVHQAAWHGASEFATGVPVVADAPVRTRHGPLGSMRVSLGLSSSYLRGT